ncbi:MAG: hypothetical protein MMC33_009011 [Icmadophila ericetorum]|nr:hypothetical protein [Icmadophila ericetorum]
MALISAITRKRAKLVREQESQPQRRADTSSNDVKGQQMCKPWNPNQGRIPTMPRAMVAYLNDQVASHTPLPSPAQLTKEMLDVDSVETVAGHGEAAVPPRDFKEADKFLANIFREDMGSRDQNQHRTLHEEQHHSPDSNTYSPPPIVQNDGQEPHQSKKEIDQPGMMAGHQKVVRPYKATPEASRSGNQRPLPDYEEMEEISGGGSGQERGTGYYVEDSKQAYVGDEYTRPRHGQFVRYSRNHPQFQPQAGEHATGCSYGKRKFENESQSVYSADEIGFPGGERAEHHEYYGGYSNPGYGDYAYPSHPDRAYAGHVNRNDRYSGHEPPSQGYSSREHPGCGDTGRGDHQEDQLEGHRSKAIKEATPDQGISERHRPMTKRVFRDNHAVYVDTAKYADVNFYEEPMNYAGVGNHADAAFGGVSYPAGSRAHEVCSGTAQPSQIRSQENYAANDQKTHVNSYGEEYPDKYPKMHGGDRHSAGRSQTHNEKYKQEKGYSGGLQGTNHGEVQAGRGEFIGGDDDSYMRGFEIVCRRCRSTFSNKVQLRYHLRLECSEVVSGKRAKVHRSPTFLYDLSKRPEPIDGTICLPKVQEKEAALEAKLEVMAFDLKKVQEVIKGADDRIQQEMAKRAKSLATVEKLEEDMEAAISSYEQSLTSKPNQLRNQYHRCFNCGERGHAAKLCPRSIPH